MSTAIEADARDLVRYGRGTDGGPPESWSARVPAVDGLYLHCDHRGTVRAKRIKDGCTASGDRVSVHTLGWWLGPMPAPPV